MIPLLSAAIGAAAGFVLDDMAGVPLVGACIFGVLVAAFVLLAAGNPK